jgi:hypothetical protein
VQAALMYNKLLRENTMVQFPSIIGTTQQAELIYRFMDGLRLRFNQTLKELTGNMYQDFIHRFDKALRKWGDDVNLSLFYDVRLCDVLCV